MNAKAEDRVVTDGSRQQHGVASDSARRWRPIRFARATLARHAPLVGLLAVGAALRAVVTFAYGSAFWIGPDSVVYLTGARDWEPSPIWPLGYSIFLAMLRPTGHIATVTVAQHLAVPGVAALLYATLYRAGLPRWLSTLSVVPLVLDANEIVIEHHILAETVYTAVLVIALVLVAGPRRPGLAACATAGVLLGYSAVTRTVGLPIIVLPAVFLLLRRVGWRAFVAFVVAAAVPLAGYVVDYHASHGAYAFNQYQGRFLYARTTTFADCSKLRLTPAERAVCPPEPLGHRRLPDEYLWQPGPMSVYTGTDDDAIYGSFARKAILTQPGAYLLAVGTDTLHFFQPGWPLPARTECVTERWQLPAGPSSPPGGCRPWLAPVDFSPSATAPAGATSTPLTRVLHWYSVHVATPRPAVLLAAVAALVLALARPRRLGWPGAAGLLFVGTGMGLLLVALATSAIDFRYGLTAVALVPAGTALIASRVLAGDEPSG